VSGFAAFTRRMGRLTEFAYHWPPRGVLIARALRASATDEET
jgi:hypothetical protein